MKLLDKLDNASWTYSVLRYMESKVVNEIPGFIYTSGKLGGEFENNIQFLGCTMVLISDGCAEHVAPVCRKIVKRYFFPVLMWKKGIQNINLWFYLHTCATYSKQPFPIRTMVCNYLVYQSALQSLTRRTESGPLFLFHSSNQPTVFLFV